MISASGSKSFKAACPVNSFKTTPSTSPSANACMHADAVSPGEKVLLVDDVLATGGTMQAMVRLAEDAGARIVGIGFLMELTFLSGRDGLAPHPIHTLVRYD